MSKSIEKVEAMFPRLRDDASLPELRAGVATLILESLPELETTPTYWAKVHIAEACRALYANAQRGCGTMWLRLSLINLRYAFLPASCYDEDYCPREAAIDGMPFDQLSAAAKKVALSVAAA
jgi:hypothetical protein